MGKRTNLQGFLRKEVLQSRLKAPTDNSKRRPSRTNKFETLPPNPAASEQAELDMVSIFGEDFPQDDVDSIFGENILTKEEIRREKLAPFLEVKPNDPKKKEYKHSSNPTIMALRKELETLVTSAIAKNPREQAFVRRQRSALIHEITYLEAEAEKKGERKKITRATLKEDLESFPEPLSRSEKQQIEKGRIRVEKAAARAAEEEAEEPKVGIRNLFNIQGLIPTVLQNPKRKRAADEMGDYLDGEERLRYGQPLKKRQSEVTGRWLSTLHDHLPDGGDGAGLFSDMTEEERQLFRRDLAKTIEGIFSSNGYSQNPASGQDAAFSAHERANILDGILAGRRSQSQSSSPEVKGIHSESGSQIKHEIYDYSLEVKHEVDHRNTLETGREFLHAHMSLNLDIVIQNVITNSAEVNLAQGDESDDEFEERNSEQGNPQLTKARFVKTNTTESHYLSFSSKFHNEKPSREERATLAKQLKVDVSKVSEAKGACYQTPILIKEESPEPKSAPLKTEVALAPECSATAVLEVAKKRLEAEKTQTNLKIEELQLQLQKCDESLTITRKELEEKTKQIEQIDEVHKSWST
ncbi:hypothetical protein G7Y89_g3155 [Cudoniella acicularis]|uniref:Uncharacterized protein n=1 Tax=Cudoniella acicularis TaxID=354080 RepID=A0A8H4RTS9_9HELO|nr:hypothetical protein G7Y89_g3155 [Cudoniella acicularis]